MIFLAETVTAAEGAAPAGGFNFGTIFFLILMVAVFYFMLIRPEKKRKKEAEEMRSNIQTGDRITTIGGITGTVVSVKDDKIVLETGADRVRIEFVNWAVSSNDTANEKAEAEKKKAEEAKAKAKAAKKAKKEN